MFTPGQTKEIRKIIGDYVGKKYLKILMSQIEECEQREKPYEWEGRTWYIIDNQGKPEFARKSNFNNDITQILKCFISSNDDLCECLKRLMLVKNKTSVSIISNAQIETIKIEGSDGECYTKLLGHKPANDNEENFKKKLTQAINADVDNFNVPVNDPSIDESGELQFVSGCKPAVGFSYNQLQKFTKVNGPCLGTKNEYILFLGTIIIRLMEEGWNENVAWNAICSDSTVLGHYLNSINSDHNFETTGSRKKVGKCDFGNTYKILSYDKNISGYWIAGGCHYMNGDYRPLAHLMRDDDHNSIHPCSVGWFVLREN